MSTFTPPDVLSGHLGHLTEPQQRSFETFKENLIKAGLYTPVDPSQEDPTLLRFLRARRFDVSKAQKQFADTEAWRKKHDVDTLYATFPVEEFEASKMFYPRWTGRRDRQGLPVYVFRLASLQAIAKELDKVPIERRYQRIVALWEFMANFALPLCTYLPHSTAPTPISQITTIIDLEGVAFGSMWGLRGHLQQASALATAYYPETMSATIVVNAPGFFPTIWGWIKAWFDEGTRNKVHVLGKDAKVQETMRALIDPKDLPQKYGGELDWNFEDPPKLDDEARTAIAPGEMPQGPVWFRQGKVVLADRTEG